jgi:hypothetical protein
MSNKCHTTINVDRDVLNLYQLKYPQKMSRRLEEYMRNELALDKEVKNTEDESKEKILQRLKEIQDKKMKDNVEEAIFQRKLEQFESKVKEVVEEQKVVSKDEYFQLDVRDRGYFSEIYNRLKDAGKLPEADMFVVGYYQYVCNNKMKEYTRLLKVFDKPNQKEGLIHLMDRCKVFQ